MSINIFKTRPPLLEPGEWTEDSGNPYERVDNVTVDPGASMIALRRAKGKFADGIDWLPQALKELVDCHYPKDDDINDQGVINKRRLTEEAEKLLTYLQNT